MLDRCIRADALIALNESEEVSRSGNCVMKESNVKRPPITPLRELVHVRRIGSLHQLYILVVTEETIALLAAHHPKQRYIHTENPDRQSRRLRC